MKKINLNTELTTLQGKVITKTEFVKGQKPTTVNKTVKSVLVDCLISNGRHASKFVKEEGKLIEGKDVKLELYVLAERIQAADTIEFTKPEVELIKPAIAKLPVEEYGQLIKLL